MIVRKRLGDMLVDEGVLERAALEAALPAAREANQRLGRYLVEQGLLRERDLVRALSSQLRIAIYNPETQVVDAELGRLVPAALASRHSVVPLQKQAGVLHLAMTDPTDILAMDAVQERAQSEVEPVICTEEELDALMGTVYGVSSAAGGAVEALDEVVYGHEQVDEAEESADLRNLQDIAEGQTAVRTVNWLLTQAVRNGASDVHISPERAHVRVRMRMDGILKELPALPKSLEASVISRLKILGKMDISVTRLPQDGRFTATVAGKEIHLRVSSMPTVHGENVVMRLLGMQSHVLSFEELGIAGAERAALEAVLERPNGMLLSTGPTGSGKTTTLYSMLSRLNQPEVNIITIEDPVEYRVERLRQVELNSKAGMTFASSLRAILRQDPDIIMVGEIRDAETASIAVQAALTGHLMLSTMHTNDAVGTVSRMRDMGVEPFLIASVLKLVIAQRLLRRLCKHCAVAWEPSAEALEYWGLAAHADGQYKQARGCGQCRQSGYRGRVGIYEMLAVDGGVQEAILHNRGDHEILQQAERAGFKNLKRNAAETIHAGLTSMEEAASVVIA